MNGMEEKDADASALRTMSDEDFEALVDQLRDGGIMVIPVAGEMLRVVRRGEQTDITRHGGYRFVPLR